VEALRQEEPSSRTGSQQLSVGAPTVSSSGSQGNNSPENAANGELVLDGKSANRLHHPLPPCVSLSETKMTISSFIKQNMRTQRLYSRSSDHERLVQLYQESISRPTDELSAPPTSNQRKTNAIIISGLPGVGKTSLAVSLESRVLSHNGFFIRTKFSKGRPQQQDAPLAPIIFPTLTRPDRSPTGRGFNESLALLETMERQSSVERHQRMRLVQSHLKVFRYWTKHCPANFMGKLYLIQAELTHYQGDALQAQAQYYCSIVHNGQGGILLEHTLANERAGKFELELGNQSQAREYLQEAFRLYQEWGGVAKVDHLRKQVGHLVDLPQ
jgi:hypothetical protein